MKHLDNNPVERILLLVEVVTVLEAVGSPRLHILLNISGVRVSLLLFLSREWKKNLQVRNQATIQHWRQNNDLTEAKYML